MAQFKSGHSPIVQILPIGDPQPPLSVTGRAARAAYGLARTMAWLPPARNISASFTVGYLSVMLTGSGALLFLARTGLFKNLRAYNLLFGFLALFAVPFIGMGLSYFPSDPERWVFLLPVIWMLIGLIVNEYLWASSPHFPSHRTVVPLLAAVVVLLGLYNGLYKLFPESRHNRDLSGLSELASTASSTDLVISPGGISGPIYELFLGKRVTFANLTIVSLVEKHGANKGRLQSDLETRIREQLKTGGHVYVYGLIGEGHRKGENYPWAHVTHFDYGPETFLTIFEQFERHEVVSPTPAHTGTFRLTLKPTAFIAPHRRLL